MMAVTAPALPQSTKVYGFDPVSGPSAFASLPLVFVRGDDDFEQGAVYKSYRDLVPAKDEMTIGSMRSAVTRVQDRLISSSNFTTPNGTEMRLRVLKRLQVLAVELAALPATDNAWSAFRTGTVYGAPAWAPGNANDAQPLVSDLAYFPEDNDGFALVAWRDTAGGGGPVVKEFFTFASADETREIRCATRTIEYLIDRSR